MNTIERQQFAQHLAALNCFAAVDLNLNYENAIHTLECIHNTLQTLQFINYEHLLEMRDRIDCSVTSSDEYPVYKSYSRGEHPVEDDASEYSESVSAKLRAYDKVPNITSSHFHDGTPSLITSDDDSMPSLISVDEDISQIIPTESQDYYIEVVDDMNENSKHFVPIRPPAILICEDKSSASLTAPCGFGSEPIDLTNEEDHPLTASDWNWQHGVPSTNALDNIHYVEHYTIPPELEYGLGIESYIDHIHPNVTVRRSKRVTNK